MVMIIIGLAFYPTFRKSWNKPGEETFITYVLAGLRSFIGIFAIYHFSFLTVTYPVYLVIINLAFICLVLARKRALNIK